MPHSSLFSRFKYQYQLRVSDELHIYILKSLRDVLLLAFEIFVENTMAQFISTFDHNRIPLRDTGYEILLNTNAKKIAYFSYDIAIETLAIYWVLFCFLHGSQGLIVLQRSVRSLTLSRTLRMCVFSLTILPSPKHHCRFTGPVDPFNIRVGGACNDLLYSGHVTVYTVIAVSLTILLRKHSSKIIRYSLPIFIWFYIIQRIMRTILEHHHYTIDMLVGLIITSLIWHCKPLHIDLPKVPENLLLHLKQLTYPNPRSILKEV